MRIGEEIVPCTICGDSALLWDAEYDEGWCATHADEYDVHVDKGFVVELLPRHTHNGGSA